jgi:hypothetical protein
MNKLSFSRRFSVFLSFFVVFLLFPTIISSCARQQKTEFGIYLIDTGELLLSDRHIESFNLPDSAFVLNKAGVKQWNSFLTTPTKLDDGLFAREFIIKIEDREICWGRIWSMLSSTLYEGTVLYGFLYFNNTVRIESFYPGSDVRLDSTILTELTAYFKQQNKLEVNY